MGCLLLRHDNADPKPRPKCNASEAAIKMLPRCAFGADCLLLSSAGSVNVDIGDFVEEFSACFGK